MDEDKQNGKTPWDKELIGARTDQGETVNSDSSQDQFQNKESPLSQRFCNSVCVNGCG